MRIDNQSSNVFVKERAANCHNGGAEPENVWYFSLRSDFDVYLMSQFVLSFYDLINLS